MKTKLTSVFLNQISQYRRLDSIDLTLNNYIRQKSILLLKKNTVKGKEDDKNREFLSKDIQNAETAVKNQSKLEENSHLQKPNKFSLWALGSPEYYWWHKRLVDKKKVEKYARGRYRIFIFLLENQEDLFSLGGNNSFLSYKNMDNIKEEQNQLAGG